MTKTIKEILRIIFIGIAVFYALSIISFDHGDVAWLTTEINMPIKNFTGLAGAYLVCVMKILFGSSVWTIPFLFLYWSLNIVKLERMLEFVKEAIGALIFVISVSGLCALFASEANSLAQGGIIGHLLSSFFFSYFNFIGSFLILSIIVILSCLLATEFYFVVPFIAGFKLLYNFSGWSKQQLFKKEVIPIKEHKKTRITYSQVTPQKKADVPIEESHGLESNEKPKTTIKVIVPPKVSKPDFVPKNVAYTGSLPPISLLDKAPQ